MYTEDQNPKNFLPSKCVYLSTFYQKCILSALFTPFRRSDVQKYDVYGGPPLRAFGHLGLLPEVKVKCPLGIWAFRQNSGIKNQRNFRWAFGHFTEIDASKQNTDRAFGHSGTFHKMI